MDKENLKKSSFLIIYDLFENFINNKTFQQYMDLSEYICDDFKIIGIDKCEFYSIFPKFKNQQATNNYTLLTDDITSILHYKSISDNVLMFYGELILMLDSDVKLPLYVNFAVICCNNDNNVKISDIFISLYGDINNGFDELSPKTIQNEILSTEQIHMYKEKCQTDQLTGLNNRYYLENYFTDYYFSLQLFENYTFILVDLDNFKQINDKFGHLEGDIHLKKFSCMLKNSFPEAFVVRIGGDEFLIILYNPQTKAEISSQLNIFLKKVKDNIQFKIPLTCSAGVYICDENCKSLKEVLKKTDDMLYEAKSNGKNQFRIYSDENTY